MAVIDLNWNPSPRQLRQFAALSVVMLPMIGWLSGGSWTTISILAAGGGLLAAVSFVAPALVRPLFLAVSVCTFPIGLILGELALAMIYFGMILPIGILFRLIGRDALQLRIDREAKSYWQAKQQPKNVAGYYRQS